MPENIMKAIQPISVEEWEKQEARLQELEALSEQGVNTQDEEAELLIGEGVKTDQVLNKFIGNSSSYWRIIRKYYLAYTKEEQVKVDGGKLLYFQLPEYYQQLNYLSEIAAKY